MIGVMVVNSVWHPLSNLLLSMNRQSSYSYFYAILAMATVGASWLLCLYMGVAGAGLAILSLDIVMAVHVGRLILRLIPIRPPLPEQRDRVFIGINEHQSAKRIEIQVTTNE